MCKTNVTFSLVLLAACVWALSRLDFVVSALLVGSACLCVFPLPVRHETQCLITHAQKTHTYKFSERMIYSIRSITAQALSIHVRVRQHKKPTMQTAGTDKSVFPWRKEQQTHNHLGVVVTNKNLWHCESHSLHDSLVVTAFSHRS